MTPKSLLRHPDARSTTAELESGHFHEVLDDPSAPDKAERIILATGKVAYQLMEARENHDGRTAVVRIEQLYPFPYAQIAGILERYSGASEIRWVQEEPINMGAWTFINARLGGKLPADYRLTCFARPESASPATGSARVHEQEQAALIDQALKP